MNRRRVMLFVLLLLAGMGCSRLNTQDIKEDSSQEKETITVGYIGPQSGDSAIIGEANVAGVKIAFQKLQEDLGKDLNLKLIIEDDQFDERQSISAYQKLVNIDHADYILDATYGAVLSLAGQAQNDGVLLINPLDSSEELSNLSENTFSIGIYDESIGLSIADYLNNQGAKNIGVLALYDPFTDLVKGAFKERVHASVEEEGYTINDSDFRTTLLKFKQKDAIVLLGWEESGRIVKQARELGFTQEIIGIDTFASEDFRKNTQGSYNGLKFAFWQGASENAEYTKLLDAYQKTYGKDPENILFTATGYDAMRVMGQAIKECGKDTACARKNIQETKNFPGATGLITVDHDNVTRSIQETIHYYDGEQIRELK
ncbi:MAG: hypothetical protein COV59_05280 [Candidatus Magasanikbacteria bacterium CG11_big_fil_rev_8_21_14_0_20_39_34]|uniref:Leucine-binding protein domain-containing protein n=1 Tax=Candidatus Magasanikbacteria bacterium CG11_big_fil_rev_8_21_14_0_20_39_34 TaxID=1974653 RepID=A0A2H0N3U5_9BACT|nr:MAG: hypothetical protein COV59_05280 [Candidatus Magasanikbacteria bacterium CG11_big_fil_rev_8_21_14_0_20_39_34]